MARFFIAQVDPKIESKKTPRVKSTKIEKMVSVWDVLAYISVGMSVRTLPAGDAGDRSLVPGGGSPVAAKTPRPGTSASDLLTLIRADKGLQINLLVMSTAVLIAFQVLLGSRRRLSRNKFIENLLRVAYAVSFPLYVSSISLIQSVEAAKRIDSQLLWAVGLLLLIGSLDGMSTFRRDDVERTKGIQADHIPVLWLLVSRSDVSEHRWILLLYFLLCWVYSIWRGARRMKARRMASSAHHLLRSAKVMTDYMQRIYVDETHDPRNMAMCKYLVLSEEKDSSSPSEAPYLAKASGKGKVVTLDMICNSKDKLLSRDDAQTRALKDTCLSFALFKLLKRRFGGFPIAEEGDPRALEFVLAQGEHAFHLVEVELSFLYDFFYTNYPAFFPASPLLGVLRFIVLLGLFKVLLFDFAVEAIASTEYSSPAVVFVVFNNSLVVFMIIGIDILQGIATGYSNWAIVHYVCDHVSRRTDGDSRKQGRWMTAKRCWERGFGIRRALIKWLAERRAGKPANWLDWDSKLGQYSLLNSYSYTASKTNVLLTFTSGLVEKIGLMEKIEETQKHEEDVTLTAEIKKAVLCSLRETDGRLTVSRSPKLRDKLRHLHWRPFDLPTSTHTVLVWHIATTICDDQDTSNSKKLPDRVVATTLSGYSAYLLAFVPGMLPDNSYEARQMLDAVVLDAREHLGETQALSDRCIKMLQLKAPDMHDTVNDMSILVLGADLARHLLLENKRPPWDLLAGLWADLVLFLAPSDKPDVHADRLAAGGEFMTRLWALLTHAGIVDRPDKHAASHV